MKGVKCIKRLFYLVLLICAFAFISPSKSVSAASLTTSSYGVWWQNFNMSSYVWNTGLAQDQGLSQPKYIKHYQVVFNQIRSTGTYALVHFETNLVYSTRGASMWTIPFKNFVDTPSVFLNGCNVQGQQGFLENLESSVETYLTLWNDGTVPGSTMNNTATFTVKVDVSLAGLPANQDIILECYVASTPQGEPFFDNHYNTPSDFPFQTFYFEQNPASITMSQNASDVYLQQQIEQNQTIINNQNQINDFLTDDTPPSADTSVLSGSAGWLPAGPVDSLLTLPITLAQGILDVFTGNHQCRPISLPLSLGPYSFNLDIPCMDSYFSLASVNIIWNAVGVIISAFVIYSTLKWLYTFVDETLSFRENNSGLWGGL